MEIILALITILAALFWFFLSNVFGAKLDLQTAPVVVIVTAIKSKLPLPTLIP